MAEIDETDQSAWRSSDICMFEKLIENGLLNLIESGNIT